MAREKRVVVHQSLLMCVCACVDGIKLDKLRSCAIGNNMISDLRTVMRLVTNCPLLESLVGRAAVMHRCICVCVHVCADTTLFLCRTVTATRV